MSLDQKIILKWYPVISSLFYLDQSEWKEMINTFLKKLDEQPTSSLLKKKLELFLIRGYTITISNKDPSDRTIYPKFKCLNSTNVLIIIPNVPYFISTQVSTRNSIIEEQITGFISFTHELIHTLRFFEGKMKSENEEENVIFGFDENILGYVINDQIIFVTENTIRQEYGYKHRLNHESKELLCHEVLSTYKNRMLYSKFNFY